MTDFGAIVAKIRIFTDIVPDPNSTSGLLLDQIFNNVAQNHDLEFCIIGSYKPSSFIISEALTGAKFSFLQGPAVNWSLGILTKLYSRFLIKYFHSDIERISSWVLQEDSRDTPDHQIFVLQSTASIIICEKFRRTTSSYTTISFDPWRWWSSTHHVPTSLDAMVSQNLEKIYSEGFHLVPNSRWQELFPNSKGTFIAVYPTFQRGVHKSKTTQVTQSNINFCFAGQIYAFAELNKFIEFMDSKDWMLFNKKAILHIYGPTNPFSSKNVFYHGNLRSKSLVHELSQHDYALLPYLSGAKDQDIARLSFPSKYLSYLAADLPVIYIGNTEATVCNFTKQTGISINPCDFLNNFESEFAKLLSSREAVHFNIESLLSKNFSEENLLSTISDWLESAGITGDQVLNKFSSSRFELTTGNFTDFLVKSKSSTISKNVYNLRWYIKTPKMRFIEVFFMQVLLSGPVMKLINLVTVFSIKIYNSRALRSVFPSNH